jgi:hypothetical protein
MGWVTEETVVPWWAYALGLVGLLVALGCTADVQSVSPVASPIPTSVLSAARRSRLPLPGASFAGSVVSSRVTSPPRSRSDAPAGGASRTS